MPDLLSCKACKKSCVCAYRVQITERLEETLHQYDARALSGGGRYNWSDVYISCIICWTEPPQCINHAAHSLCECMVYYCSKSIILQTVRNRTVHVFVLSWLVSLWLIVCRNFSVVVKVGFVSLRHIRGWLSCMRLIPRIATGCLLLLIQYAFLQMPRVSKLLLNRNH